MKKVLIIVPTTNKQVAGDIASLFGMAHGRNFLQNDYHFSTSIQEGISPVTAARNSIAKFFLDSDHDILWMIDQDIIPGPEVFDLLEVDGDIVAPMMPTFRACTNYDTDTYKFEFPICAINFKDFTDLTTKCDPDFEQGGVLDVDGVGFGCTLIRRHVLEDKNLWASPEFTKLDGRPRRLEDAMPQGIFQSRYLPNGVLEMGEDYDFCYRAKALGYSVKVHADIMVGHLKQIDLQRILGIREMLDLRQDVKEKMKMRATM